MGHIQSLADVISMIKRHLWLLLAVLTLGLAATFLVSLRMPHSYETYASLRVELPNITSELTAAQSTSHSAQRLQLLEHQLTSRDNLLRLADQYGIYESEGLSQAQRALAMRKAIRLETVRTQQNGPDQQVSALVIVVQMPSARLAADVANDLAAQTLELTSSRQSTMVQETLEFYAAEDARLQDEIRKVEADITAFKNDNVNALPENMVSLRAQINTLEASIRTIDNELMTLEQERRTISGRSGFPRAVEQRQLENIEAKAEMFRSQRATAEQARLAFENDLNRMPNVETQLGTMTRHLQQLQDQYSVITRRRAEAETGKRLDTERQTERFELLESALPPDSPMASGRKKVLALGFGVTGILAMAILVLLEMRNPVLRSSRQFEKVTGMRPVIALPNLPAVKPSRKKR